jgi:hypothetical protein
MKYVPFSLVLLLAACGGGGDDGNPQATAACTQAALATANTLTNVGQPDASTADKSGAAGLAACVKQ